MTAPKNRYPFRVARSVRRTPSTNAHKLTGVFSKVYIYTSYILNFGSKCCTTNVPLEFSCLNPIPPQAVPGVFTMDVPNLPPNCRVPVSSSYRIIPEYSVGYIEAVLNLTEDLSRVFAEQIPPVLLWYTLYVPSVPLYPAARVLSDS